MIDEAKDKAIGIAGLKGVGSQRIRNLIRGAITTNEPAVLRRTIESIRRECSVKDANEAFEYLYTNPSARHLPLGKAFPDQVSDVEGTPYFESGSFEVEFAAQLVRIKQAEEKIVEAITLIGRINEAALSSHETDTAVLFDSYRKEFGISLLIASKAISLRHAGPPNAQRQTLFGNVIAPFLGQRRQIIPISLEDSVDWNRDYLKVRRTFIGFALKQKLKGEDAAIITDLFSPLRRLEITPPQRLQAYGRWGVVDAIAYLFRLSTTTNHSGTTGETARAFFQLPTSIVDAWQSSFRTIDVTKLSKLICPEGQLIDHRLYTHLPAWSEYGELHKYRVQVEAAIGERMDGSFPVTGQKASSLIAPSSTVSGVLSAQAHFENSHELVSGTNGVFFRTISLIASVEAGTVIDMDGEQLHCLLDQTMNVANFLSLDELKLLMPRKAQDLLYEFLRTALGQQSEGSRVTNHALRRSLQRLILERFDGDIVTLLEYLTTDYGHVATYLVNLCNEAFMTELYDLYKEADQVTEAQAKILEWEGNRNKDEDALLLAKSHRLNLRLRKVRGAIDETRIYVDPLKFLEWIQEKIGGELRMLSSQVDSIVNDLDRLTSLRDTVRVALQPRLQLLKLLDNCYAEFCTNKIYGVSSFIGRRIRHGTLHGHLVLELQPEVDAVINEYQDRVPAFSDQLSKWILQFDLAVQHMAADRIHVRSRDKPRGLIVASLDEIDKSIIANLMLDEVAASMREI